MLDALLRTSGQGSILVRQVEQRVDRELQATFAAVMSLARRSLVSILLAMDQKNIDTKKDEAHVVADANNTVAVGVLGIAPERAQVKGQRRWKLVWKSPSSVYDVAGEMEDDGFAEAPL